MPQHHILVLPSPSSRWRPGVSLPVPAIPVSGLDGLEASVDGVASFGGPGGRRNGRSLEEGLFLRRGHQAGRVRLETPRPLGLLGSRSRPVAG